MSGCRPDVDQMSTGCRFRVDPVYTPCRPGVGIPRPALKSLLTDSHITVHRKLIELSSFMNHSFNDLTTENTHRALLKSKLPTQPEAKLPTRPVQI